MDVSNSQFYTFPRGNTITPIRTPARVGVFGKTGSGKEIYTKCTKTMSDICSIITGKSYAIERMVQELPLWFTDKFTCVYYLHPAGSRLAPGSIREQHINNLRSACDKHDVGFREMSGNPDDFLRSIEDEDITPRLCIIDDLASKLFASEQGYDSFTMKSHHFEVTFVSRTLRYN